MSSCNHKLTLLLALFLTGLSIYAKDRTYKSNYSYDPYYEDKGTVVRNVGNYQVKDRTDSDRTVGLEAYTKIGTSYLWRGVTRNDDFYWENGLSLSLKNFTLSLTGFVDFTDYGVGVGYGDQSFEITELDLALSYEDRWGDLLYAIELKHYLFPNKFTPVNSVGRFSNESTSEINLLLGYDIFLNPSLLISADIDESQGLYFELGCSYDKGLNMWGYSTRLTFSGGLGMATADFNDYHFGVDSFTTTGIHVKTTWTWMMNSDWLIVPEIGINLPLDGDISDAMDAANNVQSGPITFYFGIKTMIAF